MYLLGIDQGTSGSRALVLDLQGNVRGYGYRPLARLHPHPAWVEQDPLAVVAGVQLAVAEALQAAQVRPIEILACGIASQRDTDFVWDAHTRRPLSNAISWQDLRTQPLEQELWQWPQAAECRARLGYWPGPYSAALHLKWRLQHEAAVQAAARNGNLRVGLSAEWLVNALGELSAHHMDVSLVQSMGLYDFRQRAYWQDWLDWLGLPVAALPAAMPTVHEFGVLHLDGAHIPVRAMIGDQQGALFGYDCRTAGEAECTHGTATFVNVCLGGQALFSDTLKTYLCWLIGAEPTYCLEADTTVTGAVVRWLHESLHLFNRDDELGELAASVTDAGGVMFVPALTGLNVPYNDRHARGTVLGLTLGHTRAHLARAFLDSIGFQLRAIFNEIERASGVQVQALKVGGGLSASDIACQVQADWLGLPIIRPTFTQTTARAAALLAGLGAGVWPSVADLPALPGGRTVFEPRVSTDQRDTAYAAWQRAIRTARAWGQDQ